MQHTNTSGFFLRVKQSWRHKKRQTLSKKRQRTQSHIKITLTANLLLKCTPVRQTNLCCGFCLNISSARHLLSGLNIRFRLFRILDPWTTFGLCVVCVNFKWRRQKWQNNWRLYLFGIKRCKTTMYKIWWQNNIHPHHLFVQVRGSLRWGVLLSSNCINY